jgi:hypothetical protein
MNQKTENTREESLHPWWTNIRREHKPHRWSHTKVETEQEAHFRTCLRKPLRGWVGGMIFMDVRSLHIPIGREQADVSSRPMRKLCQLAHAFWSTSGDRSVPRKVHSSVGHSTYGWIRVEWMIFDVVCSTHFRAARLSGSEMKDVIVWWPLFPSCMRACAWGSLQEAEERQPEIVSGKDNHTMLTSWAISRHSGCQKRRKGPIFD